MRLHLTVRIAALAALSGSLVAPLAGPGAPAARAAASVDEMPPGVALAAHRALPSLPAPAGWPFGEEFPRTMGVGRIAAGAFFFTDFIYDDYGALGAKGSRTSQASLAPSRGTYTYPPGNAMGNGADVFRTAIGADATDTYWRVDWNTLVDHAVPAAMFALDVDDDAATGTSSWPAGAGLRSPGNDAFIVVTAAGGTLIAASGSATAVPVTVDAASRSFIARVPRTLLDPSGTAVVRLASGLAAAGGSAFAPVPVERGALPGQPAVYNLVFRGYADEPSVQNFWFENSQAQALAAGSAPYKAVIDWSALAAGTTEPEPQPTGWSNRWYVSSIELGQGVVPEPSGSGDVKPNYLGRVQPYGVFVPTTYDHAQPAPLTWVLHSLSVMHNQYSAISPKLLAQACEARGSICATTLGRAPDMWYVQEAELDFWEVWRDLADHFTLDPDGTVISGYSMGGYGSYRLGLTYPDVFAKIVALAGPPGCGLRVNRQIGGTSDSSPTGVCAKDGDTTALLPNARWTPAYIAHGALDELVPVTSVLEQVGELDRLGFRHHFKLFPAEDHMVFAVQDGFSAAAASMAGAARKTDPGQVTLVFYPHASRADYGLGPTGAWWVRTPTGRNTAPGILARVDASSLARPDPLATPVRSRTVTVPGDPTPSIDHDLSWALAPAAAPANRVDVTLTNIASVDVDLAGAGIPTGTSATVSIESTDGPSTLRLTGLAPGDTVLGSDGTTTTADAGGIATLAVPPGTTVFTM